MMIASPRPADSSQVIAMEWRQCLGYSKYDVSECGDLRTRETTRSRLKHWRHRGCINTDGYVEYAIEDDAGVRRHVGAHVLVAEAFLGPRPKPSLEVAHSNGSRVCNCAWNLRWATRAENDGDMVVHGTSRIGARNGRAKLDDESVLALRQEYLEIKRSGKKRSVKELENKYGLCRAQVVKVAKGGAWKHVEVRP